MSGLESTTQDHYMYKYDPEYVKLKRTPGYDPHLELGILSGMITQDESDFYKWYLKKK